MNIESNYPLSKLTTFHIGGPAQYYTKVASLDELKQALDLAKEKSLPILVLGNGSNVLVSDDGFDGLVIHNKMMGLVFEQDGLVKVGAGQDWDSVVLAATEKNLAGIECLSGVPGSAGGALVQNIGAYGQTLSDVVVSVSAIETTTGKEKVFNAGECQFAYRTSFFKANPNKYIVTSFQLRLKINGEPTITYAHVAKHFENKVKPNLAQVRQWVIKIRGSKGYLIMEGFPSYNTAGSFFKNPVVTQEQFEKLKPILGDSSLNRFWETPNGYKIAAAFLVQEAGFGKGYREGNVGISPKHSLSIVNFGNAKAVEVRNFAEKIKQAVFEKFGVNMAEEILYV